jgi:hypothetical protein
MLPPSSKKKIIQKEKGRIGTGVLRDAIGVKRTV